MATNAFLFAWRSHWSLASLNQETFRFKGLLCQVIFILRTGISEDNCMDTKKGTLQSFQNMEHGVMSNNSQLLLNTTQVLTENYLLVSPPPLLTIIRVTVCSIGTLANSLVIFVVVQGSLRKSVFMNLLMILAIFDSLCLMSKVNVQKNVFGQMLFGPSMVHCSLTRFLLSMSDLVSSWLTVLISVERFIAIYYPFKVHIYCTKKISHIVIITMAIIACLGAIPVFFVSAVLSSDNGYDYRITFSSGLVLAYRLIFATFYTIVPSIAIAIFSILMIKKLRVQNSFRTKSLGKRCTHISSAANKSRFVMMVSVCLVFVVTSFPCTIVVIVTESFCFSQGLECMYDRDWHFNLHTFWMI